MGEGITAVTEIMAFLESSTIFSKLLSLALVGVGLSLIMSIFFRKG